MKTKLTLFLSIAGLFPLFAQHSLQNKHNMYRAGDEITRQQVEYKDPGRSGENVLWDFSRLKVTEEEYKLTYHALNDSLVVGTERETSYYYCLSGDSLLFWGFENASTLLRYRQPALLMKFPVRYGDYGHGYFSGKGKYCDRLKTTSMGTLSFHADALGMLILPGKDTLHHVIRVRTVVKTADTSRPITFAGRDTVDSIVSSDSIDRALSLLPIHETETYRWYAKGYRYPIFETVRNTTTQYDETVLPEEVSFFYPPKKHVYPVEDVENLSVREDPSLGVSGAEGPWAGLTYNFYPNPVVTNLEAEIYMPGTGQVRMQLGDRMGKILWQRSYGALAAGVHHLSIPMSPFIPGEYVLNMWFDDYPVGAKILKIH